MTVDGVGSTWTNTSFLGVGNDGNGMLNILNGGMVGNADGFIGFGSTGLARLRSTALALSGSTPAM